MNLDGEYFWIVLLVFYLIFQVLGGRKKKKKKQRKQRRPDAAGQRRSDVPGTRRRPATERKPRDAELDDALQEIRRALGFPDPAEQAHQRAPDAPTRARELEGQVEPDVRLDGPAEEPGRPEPEPQASTSRPIERPLKQLDATAADGSIRPSQRFEKLHEERKDGVRREVSASIPPPERPTMRKPAASPKMSSNLIRKRLSRAHSFREAFLMKEILERPRSIRPHR